MELIEGDHVEHRKKRAGKLLFVLFLFFFAILIVLFFQSSYSKVQTIFVTGTERLMGQDIIAQSGIELGNQILLVRESNVRELLLNNPLIKEVELEINFPGKITIHIEEYRTVAYYYHDQSKLYPVMENGYVLEQEIEELINHPILTEWEQRELLPNFCNELSQLNVIVLQQISEVRLVPSETDPYKLILYMRDGFEVQTSIIQFAKHLKNYHYVVENLDGKEPGVISLSDAGVYYISYKELDDSLEINLD